MNVSAKPSKKKEECYVISGDEDKIDKYPNYQKE